MKKARFPAFLLLAMAVSLISCEQKPPGTGLQAEPGAPDEGSVSFDIEPVGGAGIRQWLATYTGDGKSAKFRIEFGATRPSSGVLFGAGKFIAVPGSDASTFLRSLKTALGAKSLPSHTERVRELPFQLAVIGDNLSRASGGGFNAQPPGDWTATKIFLAGGEAEVFLNTNTVLGKAEFSIKDPDDGDQVLAELAKVL